MYDRKVLKAAKFDIPVISVGNLSVGGTGKTPHVEYLLELLKYVYQVGTLSRGYGRRSHGFVLAGRQSTAAQIGDEPMLYHIKHPEAMVAVGEERSMAIPRMLQQRPGLDVILLDDAYQHRALKPGLSILLTEYERPFTRDELLPAGWLREAPHHYHRADIIIVTKCPDLSGMEKLRLKGELNPYPYQHVYFSKIAYGPMYPLFRREDNRLLEEGLLHSYDLLLVSGIADSSKLVKYLEEKSNKVYEQRHRDHHVYDAYDMENIREAMANLPSARRAVVTTEKDAVRLWPFRDWFLANNIPIFVQPIRIEFAGGDAELFNSDIIKYIEISRREAGLKQVVE